MPFNNGFDIEGALNACFNHRKLEYLLFSWPLVT